jgi:hypothetical protein
LDILGDDVGAQIERKEENKRRREKNIKIVIKLMCVTSVE